MGRLFLYDLFMKITKSSILVLNGSPQGARGNCSVFIKKLQKKLQKKVALDIVHLKTHPYSAELRNKILNAEAIIFTTGTYWDSWGSPLQRLLEEMTDIEGHKKLMGKPCAVFVFMHSIGGKGILSRLQGVLSTFGFLIPPMSGMVYSLVSDIALKSKSSHAADFWHFDDADLIVENLMRASQLDITWQTWPVDMKDAKRVWLK